MPPFKHSGRRDESWTREIQRMRLAMCQLVFNLWLAPRATGRADSPSLPLPVLLSVCRHHVRNLGPSEITIDQNSYAWNEYRRLNAMKGKYKNSMWPRVFSCIQCIRQSRWTITQQCEFGARKLAYDIQCDISFQNVKCSSSFYSLPYNLFYKRRQKYDLHKSLHLRNDFIKSYDCYEEVKQAIALKFKIDNIACVFLRSSKRDNIWTITFYFPKSIL